MEVRIVVDNAGTRLKAGMFAKVKIITEQKSNVVKIPASALIQRFGDEYVFVAVPDLSNPGGFTAQRRIVVPGIIIDGVMEVEQGIYPGEDVVVRGQGLLADGSRVNIVDRVTPLN
jgi:multidrug efflux pump subunit AcrA (membrane-fusion protein)